MKNEIEEIGFTFLRKIDEVSTFFIYSNENPRFDLIFGLDQDDVVSSCELGIYNKNILGKGRLKNLFSSNVNPSSQNTINQMRLNSKKDILSLIRVIEKHLLENKIDTFPFEVFIENNTC